MLAFRRERRVARNVLDLADSRARNFPQQANCGVHVLQGNIITGHRAYARESIAERINSKCQERKKVANFVALEQAAQVQDGNTA